MGFAPENQVRTGLAAGGNEIRTFGTPTVNERGLSAEQAGFEILVPYRAARSRKGCDVSWVLTAARLWRNVRPLGRVLFCELGPAGADQAIGIFLGHLDDERVWTAPIPGGALRRT